jgi:hypothetical protein
MEGLPGIAESITSSQGDNAAVSAVELKRLMLWYHGNVEGARWELGIDAPTRAVGFWSSDMVATV